MSIPNAEIHPEDFKQIHTLRGRPPEEDEAAQSRNAIHYDNQGNYFRVTDES